MIDEKILKNWAKVAEQYILDSSMRYNCRKVSAEDIYDFSCRIFEDKFRRDVPMRDFFNDAVGDKVEQVLDQVIVNEDRMTQAKTMAEALKVTYGIGFPVR